MTDWRTGFIILSIILVWIVTIVLSAPKEKKIMYVYKNPDEEFD